VLYNQAAVRRVKGDRRAAQSYLAQARALPASAQTPVTRGRLALLASELNMLAGSPAAALTELAAADSAFLQGGLRSWQGTALLRRAHLYTGLGMHDEAYRAVHEALHTFVPKEAPARIADALQEMASLALDQDQFADAHHWSTLAQGIYRTLHLDVEMAWAGLSELEAALRSGDAGADAELAALAKQHPHLRYDARYCLARARGALLKPDPAAALTWLDDTQCWGLGEAERLSAASLRAAALHAQGQTDRALSALDVAGSELGERAAAASGAGLAFAAVRQAVRLRDVAALIAHDQPARLSAQRWFALALNSNPQIAAARAGGAASTLELAASDQLAELLLADEPTRRKLDQQMARSQLQALARPAAALPKPGGRALSLPDVQRELPSDVLMLVVIPAEPGSVALWIAHDGVSVVPLPGRRAMADAIASLQASLASSNLPQDAVSRAASEVSAVMLSGAPSGPPPRQLWVLSDELIGTAPLALLHWPGAAQPLVETTDLSWITTIAPAPLAVAASPTAASAQRPIDVLVAANTGAEASTHLAPLLSADYEPQLIASAGERLRVRPKVGSQATREALADALQRPAAWVHLAAHGYAKPSLLGYAGVWMAPAPGGGEPQFLSWLDIADLPLRADLAVLNACQLAAGPSATSQSSLSFAAAVSTAGVANVIAASWPVSDAATQVWVPAFYRALDPTQADSSASALRAAQLALRRSRHFRHPYYWASLGHFRHLMVTAEPAATQP
jgi:CHAT domain-containing protein